ncbi:hypothetical protein HK100_003748 [Physocladia obscura]|uniref:Pre-mRNA-splicing factor 38 n=1 Tax=Physocladia obscura TaxID=109957 RepID=A0AAD5T7C7_9FUNG|nr:hypothetical protein HK100_003748 [Physocladia obscura]
MTLEYSFEAIDLKYVGGQFGMQRPTEFLCLTLRLLQLQPEKSIIAVYLQNEDHKYLTALAAFYLRLTFKSVDVYKYLEPLLLDKRKLRMRDAQGNYYLSYMDEFADNLLRQDRVCEIILPRITKRSVLVEAKDLDERVSPLEEDLDLMIEEEEQAEEAAAAVATVSEDEGEEEKANENHKNVKVSRDSTDREDVEMIRVVATSNPPTSEDGAHKRNDVRTRVTYSRSRSRSRSRDRKQSEHRERNHNYNSDRSNSDSRDFRHHNHQHNNNNRVYRDRDSVSEIDYRTRAPSPNNSRSSRRDDYRHGRDDEKDGRNRNAYIRRDDESRRYRDGRRYHDDDNKKYPDGKGDNRIDKNEQSTDEAETGGKNNNNEDNNGMVEFGPEIPTEGGDLKKKKKYSTKKVNALFKKKDNSAVAGSDEKSAADRGDGGGNRESMSIEETNKMRISLGLKPLKQ